VGTIISSTIRAPVTWVFVAAGFIWLAIMIDLTLSDYLTRGTVVGTRQSWQQSAERQGSEQSRKEDSRERSITDQK